MAGKGIEVPVGERRYPLPLVDVLLDENAIPFGRLILKSLHIRLDIAKDGDLRGISSCESRSLGVPRSLMMAMAKL